AALVDGEPNSPAASRPLRDLVDWDAALGYVGGDESLLRELVQAFLVECPAWLRQLDEALAVNDAQRVHAVAHPFKNSLYTLGAKGAGDRACELEKMGRAKDLTGAAAVRQGLQTELGPLMPALREFAAAPTK